MGTARIAAVMLWMLAFSGAVLAETVIHISPQGDDAASGAADAPIRTLQRLEALLGEHADIIEVVFHGGVYSGILTVPVPRGADAQKLPSLLLRAADGDEPIIDGALRLPAGESKPAAGAPGVYQLDAAPFRSEKVRIAGAIPPMWDAAARKRYLMVADLLAVKQFPASYTFTGNTLYFHTSDDRPPAEHQIEIGRLIKTGVLNVARPNVTLRELIARNSLSGMSSSGFLTAKNAEHVTFENCRAVNCSRGFFIKGRHVRLLRCRAEDVGCGVYVAGQNVLVEGGIFLRGQRDDFMVPMMDPQEDAGIEVYHPAGEEIVIRGNVIKGFSTHGVFFKCLPGTFFVEHNTLVDNCVGINWTYDKRIFASDNIISGGERGTREVDAKDVEIMSKQWASGNVLWAAAETMRKNVDYLNGMGSNNILADPRFAAPEANDFRLLPDSPGANRGGTGRHAGALGVVPENFKDTHPPLLDLAEQPALIPVKNKVDALPLFIVSRREFPLRVRARDAAGRVTQMRLRIGDEPWGDPLPYAQDFPVRLPADAGVFTVNVRVADNAGNWSEPGAIRVRAAVAPPKLVEGPTLRTNRHGIVISFLTDVECYVGGEYGPDRNYGTPLLLSGTANPGDKGTAVREHILGALCSEQDPNRPWYFRVRLKDHKGKTAHEFAGTFNLAGEPQSYYVDPAGADVETGGTVERPWRTLQYAVDRALPGDRVTVMPGLYPEGVLVTRGGVEGAPLIIQAGDKWKTVLDGQNKVRGSALFHVKNASHVEISGLELRWFGDRSFSAILLENSPCITVRECKIWNELRWGEGRVGGVGIVADKSPGFVLERSLLFRLDYAMNLSDSPRSRLVYNTFRAFSHGGLMFNGSSVQGTIVRNNSINYTGNYAYIIGLGATDPNGLKSFDADYNNLGTSMWKGFWRDEPGVAPNLPSERGAGKAVALFLRSGGTFLRPGKDERSPWSKAAADDDEPSPDEDGWEGPAVLRYRWVPDATTLPEDRGASYIISSTFEDWQAFSGQDKHSIWADPRHRDTLEFDFRLLPDSPNIGAGENGTTIGAMPVQAEKK